MANGVTTGHGWIFEKKITVPVVLLMLSYLVSVLFWIAYTDAKLKQMEKQLMDNPVIIERLAKIEENVKYHTQTLERIERILEKQ